MNKKQLRDAFSEGLIDAEKYKEELFKLEMAPKIKKTAKRLPVAVSEEEFRKLIEKTRKKVFKIAFLLGYGAGLRLSEIVGGIREDGSKIEPVTKEKIDIANRTILVEGAKGRKDRVVPMPKGFKISMLQFLPISKIYSNEASARRSLQRGFKVAARRAKLLEIKPTLHFHSLRHGFGSRLAGQGVPIHHIRTLMGHANISTTNAYLEHNPKDALKSYDELF